MQRWKWKIKSGQRRRKGKAKGDEEEIGEGVKKKGKCERRVDACVVNDSGFSQLTFSPKDGLFQPSLLSLILNNNIILLSLLSFCIIKREKKVCVS